MFKKITVLALALLLALSATACVSNAPHNQDLTPTPLPSSTAQATASPTGIPTPAPNVTSELASEVLVQTEQFALSLLQNLKNGDTSGNTFFSPLGLGAAVAALYSAADGDTQEQLRALAGFTAEPQDVTNAYAELLDAVAGEDFTVETAFALAQRMKFSQDFAATLAPSLGITAANQALGTEAGTQALNDLAARLSGGSVSKLLPSTAAADMLYILTSFGLQTPFAAAFDPNETSQGDFNAPTGRVKCPMMFREEAMDYYEDEYVQMVGLPLAGGRQMLAVLPVQGGEESFDEALIQYGGQWLSGEGLSSYPVRLSFPSFTASTSASLVEALIDMGLTDPFNMQKVDLSGLLDPALTLPTPISGLYSLAGFTVSEQGLGNAQGAQVAQAQSSEAGVELIFDRPFLLAVRDTDSGALLMLGWINTVPAAQQEKE